MPSLSVVLVALAALILQVSAGVTGQSGASINGRVVDGTTNAPVPRARVKLTGTSQREQVVTDDAGAFAFSGLPAGTYSFLIEGDGYLSTSWPDVSRWIRQRESPITLAVNDHVEQVTLTIDRVGSVAGRVTLATGEPVSSADVMIVGLGPRSITRSARTNVLGEYRVAGFPPGRYVVRAQHRSTIGDGQGAVTSGPLPTYHPSTVQRSDARALIVEPGADVREVNVRLVDGLFAVLELTVTDTDGRPVTSAMVTAVSSRAEPATADFRGSIRNGLWRAQVPPGDYTLRVDAPSALQSTPGRIVYDSTTMVKVHLTPGAREALTVVAGLNATATGRVVFEGDSAAPPVSAIDRTPMFPVSDQTCRSGYPTVVPTNWTFKIEQLSGLCRWTRNSPLSQRWALTSVIVDGRDVLDDGVWFEPGRDYEDVRIVMTDRRSQVRVRVSDANGAPTGEYAAVAFPVDRERWRHPERYIRAAAPLPPRFVGVPDPSGTGGEPGMSLRIIGLPPGDYYVIAVDDIESFATRDPAVLEKLARRAARVTIPERELTEVPLQRYSLIEVLK